jgi:hypothetical protein
MIILIVVLFILVSYLVHSRIHTGALPYKCSGPCTPSELLYFPSYYDGNQQSGAVYLMSFSLFCLCNPECGKGFRYKVSQRSHKCSGVLVKQPGELIQKLMQKSSILPSSTVTSVTVTNETASPNDGNSTPNQTQHESHDLCLDDLLKEDDTYTKLMKSTTQLIPQYADNAFSDNLSVMAFNNLTINSNYDMSSLSGGSNFNFSYPPTLETINEDSIKELLGALQ